MSNIEVYSNLDFETAVDATGENIRHPRLREMHLRMVPFLEVLDIVHVSYKNIEDHEDEELVLRQGQAVVHRQLTETFSKLFAACLKLEYPIEQLIPISQSPDSQDSYAMAHNLSVVYRPDVVGDPSDPNAHPSEHYRASAVDLNQFHNPIEYPDFTLDPPEARGHLPRLGMHLLRRQDVVRAAKKLGFEWGHDWPDPRAGKRFYGINSKTGKPRHILRDSHHFEIVPERAIKLAMPKAA